MHEKNRTRDRRIARHRQGRRIGAGARRLDGTRQLHTVAGGCRGSRGADRRTCHPRRRERCAGRRRHVRADRAGRSTGE